MLNLGLGHRLAKLSSAYHLAHSTPRRRQGSSPPRSQLGNVRNNYRGRSRRTNIRPSFWKIPLLLLPGDVSPQPVDRPLEVRITNDCPSYFTAQNMKNHQVPIPFNDTIDHILFSLLPKVGFGSSFLQNYCKLGLTRCIPKQETFVKHTASTNTLSLDFTFEAGNGEQKHFQWAGREVQGKDFLTNLETLLPKLLHRLQQQQPNAQTSAPISCHGHANDDTTNQGNGCQKLEQYSSGDL